MTAQRHATLIDHLPPLRGRAQADAPLAPFTWFRVGGPAVGARAASQCVAASAPSGRA